MKSLKNILTVTFLSLGISTIAQIAPPAPPEPPSTVYQDGNTKVTTNSSNVSVITQNGDYGKGGNTSVSISNTEDEFRMKANYPKNRYPALKKYLSQEMTSQSLQESGDSMVWWLEGNEDTVFEVHLDDDRLKIVLDKELASDELISKFESMGPILRNLISGGDARQEISRLERDADRARRNAERMQREADRLREMSGRDAERLEREAERLEREAERLGLTSKRGGGIDGYVREVLRQPSTTYQVNTSGNDGWKWPAIQNALLNNLQKDKLISGNEDIVFIKEDEGIYINGDKMSPTMWSSYDRLFKKYDYDNLGDVSFYKQGNHIAIVTSNVNLENILEDLADTGLIIDANKKSTIHINGASVEINGKKLSISETNRWNTFLHTKNVIPAPGKTIIIGKNFASMGYSFDKNTLGTWYSRD